MAKLSVYNTIDRSQLGGKFVPLIQSGVNNYKILASDLGKEYHPGDAIEITDTGEINVNYDPDTLRLSGSGLGVRTDHSRGVFDGADGIYITSADSSIGVSIDGIKVNTESLIGPGLELHAGNMITVKTKAPLSVDRDGLELLIGGAGLEIVSGCLYLDSSVVSHTASDAVYYYMSTRTGSSLSIDQDYLVVNTNYIASAGLTTGFGNYNPISVDIKYVANAIGNTYIGSGLYWDNNNYTLSANVNTATGIIVNDNKLYLNAGAGLYTTNNTVKVKSSNNTISVHSEGISVNISSIAGNGLAIGYNSIYVGSADSTINVSGNGIKVNASSIAGRGLIGYGSSIYVKSADNTIDVDYGGIKVNTGYGLETTSDGLYVKSANSFIDSDSSGVGLNLSNLYSHMDASSSNIEYNGSLNIIVAKSDTGAKITSLYSGSGIMINDSGSIDVKFDGSTVEDGLEVRNNSLYVKSADDTINVSPAGIKVNPSALAGGGLTEHVLGGSLQVLPYDNTISVSTGGVRVNYGSGLTQDSEGRLVSSLYAGSGAKLIRNCISVHAGSGLGFAPYGSSLEIKYVDSSISVAGDGIKVNAGYGLETTSNGLYVKSADNTIGVGSDGIKVNPSAIAGDGLYVGPSNGKLYVNTGLGTALRNGYVDVNAPWIAHSGLAAIHSDSSRIVVKAADNTILVGGSGIRVNTDVISGGGAAASDLVGQGLVLGVDDTLYVKSADSSITVQPEGIRVNPGNGLLTGGSGVGLCVKSANNSILVGSTGISVNTMNIAGDGLGGANNTLYVNSGALAGDGLSVDSYGRLYVTSSSFSDIGNGLYSDNGKLSVYAHSGSLGFSSTGELYVKDKDLGLASPDFSAGVAITNGYTAEYTGWLIAFGANGTGNVSINGQTVAIGSYNPSVWTGNTNCQILVRRGDIITWNYSYTEPTIKLYPIKGS